MTRSTFIIGTLTLAFLVGCAPSTHYDIDVECQRDMGLNEASDEKVAVFACNAPEYFVIQCVVATVQKVSDDVLCSTKDGKTVRIRETYSSNIH